MYQDLYEYAKTIKDYTKEKMIEEMKLYTCVLLDGEQISDYQMAKILSEVCHSF